MKKSYELMIIYKPLLPEESKDKIESKLINYIKKDKLDAEILETDVWGKRHLAYDIGDYSEGYYIVYQIELESAHVSKLTEKLNLDSDVIRHLLIDKNS